MLNVLRRSIGSERLFHALIATAFAVVVAASTILRPVDISAWAAQAKMFDHQASGNFVVIGVDPSRIPAGSSLNGELAEAVSELRNSDISQVVFNLPLTRSTSSSADVALRRQIASLGPKAIFVASEGEDQSTFSASNPFFVGEAREVSGTFARDFLGFVWNVPRVFQDEGHTRESLAWAMTDQSRARDDLFIDYNIDAATIPSIDLNDLSTRQAKAQLQDKTAILATIGSSADLVKIPGRDTRPAVYIHALAAETLVRGSGRLIDWFQILVPFSAILLVGLGVLRRTRTRLILYSIYAIALILLLASTSYFGLRVVLSGPISIAVIYALFRLVVKYKRRHLDTDRKTGLPNFTALRRDLAESDNLSEADAIAVVKVSRLDLVFASLNSEDKTCYIRQIAHRLKLSSPSTNIYHDGGKYFAFGLEGLQPEEVEQHLTGLRAIASHPVTVSDRPLDVSITIGADYCPSEQIDNRLSAAIAAADQAREAYKPVFIVARDVYDANEWDHSLQAKLEAALIDDRISINLQPQVDLRSGRIVGAEALARWHDDERGEIPPGQFIHQCERMGRLDDLTNRVLEKSTSVALPRTASGSLPTIAVNVSAIQFVDDRIVAMIRQSLDVSGFPPEALKIELTETARIENYSLAREVIEQIRQTGVRLSIDDFRGRKREFGDVM